MEPLDLPGRGRRSGPGQPVGDAVLPADPLEQHLSRAGLDEPPGKHGAVVAEHFLRHPVDRHGVDECLADGPRGGSHHGFSDDAVPGVVIDPGHGLHLAAAGQECAGSDIELPQLHRGRAFPPLVVLPSALPGLRFDQAVADQDPVNRRAGHGAVAAPVHLEHQPLRTPLRVSTAQLADRRLHLGRDLPRVLTDPVAAVRQARWSLVPVAAQPGTQALSADSVPFGYLGYRDPALTSRTARYLCSVTRSSHSMSGSVKHQADGAESIKPAG